MMRKYFFGFIFFFFAFFGCSKKALPPPIGTTGMSYPGALTAFSASDFLLLNTNANGDFADGSIQRYHVANDGSFALQKTISIDAHGSELAVTSDSHLVALGFDSAVPSTQVQFFDFTNPNIPVQLPGLTLFLNQAGGKQSVKNLHFFAPISGGNFYYLYGTIQSFAQDDASNANIPARVFAAKIAKDFTSSQILFYLSYSTSDPNSLAPKSNSLNQAIHSLQYQFGFSAPSFDPVHNLLIAFPTGSKGGFNNQGTNIFPPLPDVMNYFSGKTNGNLIQNCGFATCIQPDLRAVSMAVVDFSSILLGNPINNSTYFVPMGWNNNGIPFAARTNGMNIDGISSNSESTSFSFQTGFWDSYWVNAPNRDSYWMNSASINCFSNAPTTAPNQYQLATGNALIFAKNGPNGGLDFGNGSEVFQLTGLDILSSNINTIKGSHAVDPVGESDFNAIAPYQILDAYNAIPGVTTPWLFGSAGVRNAGPVTPYMYARTTGVSGFNSTPSAVIDFGMLNFGGGVCRPSWARDTYGGVGSVGMDSGWLTANASVIIVPGANATYPDAVVDPSTPSVYGFPWGAGAQRCVSLAPAANTPLVFCVNYITSQISRFHTASLDPVFTGF